MVKLTADLIENSRQFINPTRERELDLRGYKIPVIENLGATSDQFDVIDFCENDIRKLDGFPRLERLTTLLLCNNRISRIGDDLGKQLVKLKMLVLTNNNLAELGDIDPLASIKTLEHLSLLFNPICQKPQYRLYVIFKLPQLRVLDFKRIRLVERNCAQDLFKGKSGKALQEKIVKKSFTFTPGEALSKRRFDSQNTATLDEIRAIKAAIAKASSLEEIERLNHMLQSGQIPPEFRSSTQANGTALSTASAEVNGSEGHEGEEEQMEQEES